MAKSPAARVAEERRRRKALASFDGFVDRFTTEPPPARHHKLLMGYLEKVVSGELPRLMVAMPPGSAKSFYSSIMTPAYFLAKRPKDKIIAASHTIDLAERFSSKAQDIVRTEDYKAVTGISLIKQSVGLWNTSGGGEYLAAGVGKAIPGYRADLGLIDDPVKGIQSADSPTDRQATWDWYISDFRPRLKPNASVVVIMTRWHSDDLAGRILPEDYDFSSGWVTARDGEQWYVLCLPMEAEHDDDPLGREKGESIWPEWFTPNFIAQEKATQNLSGNRNWSSQYQQRPVPESGDYFKREWIKYYDDPPATQQKNLNLKVYGGSDYAVTADGGDFTVHGVAGVDEEDNLYILDWWREQTESDVWIEVFLDMMKRWQTQMWGEEKGQILKSVGPFLEKRMRERRVYGYRQQYPSARDKATRARAFQARMAMGKVYFPRNEPWVAELIRELLTFPAGKNDDQVDVLSLFGRMLDEMVPGKMPKKTKPRVYDRWNRTRTPAANNWKVA